MIRYLQKIDFMKRRPYINEKGLNENSYTDSVLFSIQGKLRSTFLSLFWLGKIVSSIAFRGKIPKTTFLLKIDFHAYLCRRVGMEEEVNGNG